MCVHAHEHQQPHAYMSPESGWAMFVDDDFLWTKDIAELLDMVDDTKALMCVQHDYKPTVATKLAGRYDTQHSIPAAWLSFREWNSFQALLTLKSERHPLVATPRTWAPLFK